MDKNVYHKGHKLIFTKGKKNRSLFQYSEKLHVVTLCFDFCPHYHLINVGKVKRKWIDVIAISEKSVGKPDRKKLSPQTWQ